MMASELSLFLLQAGGAGGGGLGGMLLFLLPMFALFYFFLILPQQRKQRRWQDMVNNLKTGDKVQTGGGIRGTIISIKDDALTLRVPPDNLRMEMAKSAVVAVGREDEEPATRK